jgi:hypothetical protein
VKKVNEIIKKRIAKSESQDCVVLIMPFTLARNHEGKLNENCIRKPLNYIKSRHLDRRLVYLRRSFAGRIDMDSGMDRLMTNLHAKRIKSNENYTRQANALWRIIVAELPVV